MKWTATLLLVTLTICTNINSQVTHYGTNSGLLGNNSSYFGWSAGGASTATGFEARSTRTSPDHSTHPMDSFPCTPNRRAGTILP